MARKEARGKNFRGFGVYINVFDAQKNSGKPGFFRSFPFTLRERSRMMRMSVRRKNYFAEACTWAESDKFRQVQRRDMAKLTQSQFMKELAAATEIPNKTAKAVVTAYADLAVKETKKSGMCVLPGIGRLVRVDRKARMGRNPATGEAIKIPAKKVVKFRVAKAVKDAIVPKKK
jgi:DNA-binding protein HU-beta